MLAMCFLLASFLSTLLFTFRSTLLLPFLHLHLKVVPQTAGCKFFMIYYENQGLCVFLHNPSSFSSPTAFSRSSSYHHGEFFYMSKHPATCFIPITSFNLGAAPSDKSHLQRENQGLIHPGHIIRGGFKCECLPGFCLVTAVGPLKYPQTRITWDGR